MGTKPELIPVFGREQIAARVGELGKEIDRIYGENPLVAICVLKGACIFFSDLVRSLHNPNIELDFIRLASYGKSSESSGSVHFLKDIETDIRGKHVLVVEDIVDTGHTMRFLIDTLAQRAPASLSIAALVNKKERRVLEVPVNFSGFQVPSGFLVGYGLDYAEKYRSLPEICELVLDRE